MIPPPTRREDQSRGNGGQSTALALRAMYGGARRNYDLSAQVGIDRKGQNSPTGLLLPTLCRVSDTGPLMIYPPVLRAGVRKPSGKEPAGVGGWLAVYGDLMGRPARRG